MNCSVFIPVTERNLPTVPTVVERIKEKLDTDNIVIVGNTCINERVSNLNCHFIEEDSLCEGLNIGRIKKLLALRDRFAEKRAGWYFQQFLKMSYANVCSDDEYLVWDADTIPLKHIKMHNEQGRPYFDVKEEYHWPYFSTMKKIFNKRIVRPGFSFISEHMLINSAYMKDLIKVIMDNENLCGDTFFEKILDAVNDIDLIGSGFSEFETYGNYVYMTHPEAYVMRKLKSYRKGGLMAKNEQDIENIIRNLDHEYDILTIENR